MKAIGQFLFEEFWSEEEVKFSLI